MGTDRIDLQHHIVPPGYADWIAGFIDKPYPVPHWSQDAALTAMDVHGVRTAIMSVSSPGVYLGDGREARAKAREYNEFAAEIVATDPARFGFLATLTLPDVEGAIAEAVYALDVLKADGVVIMANSAGKYLGDPDFAPLLAELDRRSANIYIHPTDIPGPVIPGSPPWFADFLLDTTRTAITLVTSGAMRRHTRLKIILAHGGGFVPFAAYRFAGQIAFLNGGSTDDTLDDFRRFYFDIAATGTPTAYPSLLAFAPLDHILYGSDWPYAPDPAVSYNNGLHENFPLDLVQRVSIDRDNALKLFPRLG